MLEHQVDAMRSVEAHWGNREASGKESYGRFLYNRFRTYDPSTGRYISADPVGQLGVLAPNGQSMVLLAPESRTRGLFETLKPVRQPRGGFELSAISAGSDRFINAVGVGTNLYGYVLNSPLNAADPLGLYDPNAICQRACDRVVPQQCPVDPLSEEGQTWIENQGPRCVATCIAKYSELAGAGSPSSEISTGVSMIDALREAIRDIKNQ